MAQTLQQRIEKIERQLHYAEREAAKAAANARDSAHPAQGYTDAQRIAEDVLAAINQARRALVQLKLEVASGMVPQ
jgi:hypothetical protein